MRLLTILGGAIGFLIGIFAGLAQESPLPTMVWRASVAAFLAGLLFRWWSGFWIKGLQQAQRQKAAEPTQSQENAGAAQVEV